MKVKTLLQRLEVLAGNPGGVEAFRKVVLKLAVQGALSDREAIDTPVSELRKELRIAKARLSAAGGRRSAAEAAGAATELLPFAIPDRWASIPLDELGELSGGMTPSMSKSAYWGGRVDWFSPKDFRSDRLRDSELKVTPLALHETGLQLYRPGSVMMVARSGILRRTFPVAINDVPATVNQDIKVLRPFVDGMERYLQLMFRGMTDFILSSLVKTGTTVQSLKYDEFSAQPFPIPPLAEQKRIVAKVDELMALCDRLEAQQQERGARHAALASASLARFSEDPTPANLEFLFHRSYDIGPEELRKTVVALATQGRLVRQESVDEPAEKLLTRVAGGRAMRHPGCPAEIPADEMPYAIPDAWRWVRLGDVAHGSDAGWSPQCLPERRAGGAWGVLKVSAVSWGVFRPEENKALPKGLAPRAECEVREGDFLLSRANTADLVARSVVVEATPPHLMLSDKIVRFDLVEWVDRRFVNLVNLSEASRAYYAAKASGTSSSMKNVSREVMSGLPVPLPPLAEQRRIVAKVGQLMALIDRLEAQLASSRAQGEKLLEAVVAELTEAARAA